MSGHYTTQEEIEAVVRGFESCTTAKDDFPHQSHLVVAVSYLWYSNLAQASERMRASLLRFIDHHQVSRDKYNETLTLFWLRLVQKSLDDLGRNISPLKATNAVIQALANSQLIFDYYSNELLWSDNAKKTWIEPDLKALN